MVQSPPDIIGHYLQNLFPKLYGLTTGAVELHQLTVKLPEGAHINVVSIDLGFSVFYMLDILLLDIGIWYLHDGTLLTGTSIRAASGRKRGGKEERTGVSVAV